jgi:hypothetical protein
VSVRTWSAGLCSGARGSTKSANPKGTPLRTIIIIVIVVVILLFLFGKFRPGRH